MNQVVLSLYGLNGPAAFLTTVVVYLYIRVNKFKRLLTNLLESRRRNEKFGWRRRSRNLLDGDDDDLCGPKQEFVPCSDPACYQFEKEMGECIPDNGKCGNGLRKNSWICRNSQGEIVAGRFCGDDQGKISLIRIAIMKAE